MVFDLQLFAEEGEMASPAEANAPAQTQEEEGGQAQGGETEAGAKPQMGLVVDSNGRRSVMEITAADALAAPQGEREAEPAAESAAEKTQEVVPGIIESTLSKQSAKPYSEQELLLAINMGNAIDESRIPPVYQAQYGEYKAKREQAAQQQAGQQQSGQTPEQAARKEFYDRIRTSAHHHALAQIGWSAEEYEAARFSDDAEENEKLKAYDIAYKFNEAAVIEQVRQQEKARDQIRQQRQEIYRDIGVVMDELKKSEPHFGEIDALMANRYLTLPYKEAHEVAQTIEALTNRTVTPEQCKVLQRYYDDTRVEFYAKQNKLSKNPAPAAKPPVVEKPGTGTSIPQNFDFSEMRKMDVRQRREYMANYFNKK